MHPASDTMIFLPYTISADAFAGGYLQWLRDVDNPFFNAIPGVAVYENWEIVAWGTTPFAYSHFDFFWIKSEADVERVWFNPELDAFRKGWIAKWGYGSAVPAAVNTHAYLMKRIGPAIAARTPQCVLHGRTDEPPGAAPARERWQAVSALRKHYSIGPAPAGQSWRVDIAGHPGPGFSWLDIAYSEAASPDPGTPEPGEVLRAVARLMAAPSLT